MHGTLYSHSHIHMHTHTNTNTQARHTGIKINQQIAILMGCAVLPHLKSMVDIIKHGLTDENQKVKTITALSLAGKGGDLWLPPTVTNFGFFLLHIMNDPYIVCANCTAGAV